MADERYRVRAVSGISTVAGEDTNDLKQAIQAGSEFCDWYPKAEVTLWDRVDRKDLWRKRANEIKFKEIG